MANAPMWRRYLRLWGPDPEAEIADELGFHLEMKERELMAQGTPAARAAREAAAAFGDRARVEAELREIGRRRQQRARRASGLDDMRTDLRHAWRSFRRRPGVPLLVVLMLSLGIGAGTAVFSVFDAVVLKPVAVNEPSALLVLEERRVTTGARGPGFSYPMLRSLNEQRQHAVGVAGYFTMSTGARAGEHAEQAVTALVTGNYFSLLGVRPQHGRLLVETDEAAPGTTPYVVVSDAYWRRALGGDPDVVGRTLAVNEAVLEIVGVAPPRFRGTQLSAPIDLWVPATMVGSVGTGPVYRSPDVLGPFYTVYEGIARLRTGATADAAVAELAVRHGTELAALPEPEFRISEPVATVLAALPFTEAAAGRSRDDMMGFLWMLAAVVGICLAVACVNVANLLLIRSTERTAEMSMRAALGGSRSRLVRQLLLESVVLAFAAGAAGVLVGLGSMRLISSFSLPGGIPLEDMAVTLDLRVLGFTAAVSLACALLFGLAPAVAGSRTDVMDALRQSAHGTQRGRWRGGNALVSVQVALSLVLLVSAFLFIRSLQMALSVDLGYRSDGVASVAVGLEQHGYDAARARTYVSSVLDEVVSRPGVSRAAASARVPIDASPTRFRLSPVGAPESRRPTLPVVPVTHGFLKLLDVPILRGRGIEPTDDESASRVAVITEGAARLMWPDEDALGREFVVMFGAPFTVIGITADAHFTRLGDREPHVFLPLAQTMNLGVLSRLHIVARGDDADVALAALRASVRAVDSRLPTFRETRFTDQLNAVLMPQRFGGVLLSAFGMIALLISAIGIYAVATYEVARRRRELGIRAALGADSRALSHTILARAGIAICVGAVAGLALASVTTRALRGLLFGIPSYEPVSYLAAAITLALAATVASWIPARRAARVDPLSVIRE